MLLVGNDMDMIKEVNRQLSSKFNMKDLGMAHFILGMDIKRKIESMKLWLSQQKYVEGILKWFNMQDCKPVKVPLHIGTKLSADQCPNSEEEIEYMAHVPYASVVGCLMYAMVYTRLEITHVVGVLSRYMTAPGKEHWTSIKRVFRYLWGTTNFAVFYHGNSEDVGVHGFIDSDWDGEIDDRRSTSGYVFILFGGVVIWMRRKHSVISLSSIEAKYIATTHASEEAVWLQRLCTEIGFEQQAVRLECASQSGIFLEKNPTDHSKKKHIDVQYHFIREMVENGKVLLEKVKTIENITELLTKLVST